MYIRRVRGARAQNTQSLKYIHVFIQCIHTHTHAQAQPHIQTHSLTHTSLYLRARALSHTHTQTHTHTRTCQYARGAPSEPHTHTLKHMRSHAHAVSRALTPSLARALLHGHTTTNVKIRRGIVRNQKPTHTSAHATTHTHSFVLSLSHSCHARTNILVKIRRRVVRNRKEQADMHRRWIQVSYVTHRVMSHI